jgi:hypothetical protein
MKGRMVWNWWDQTFFTFTASRADLNAFLRLDAVRTDELIQLRNDLEPVNRSLTQQY